MLSLSTTLVSFEPCHSRICAWPDREFADCGMTHLTNAAIRDDLKRKNLGGSDIDNVVFGEILEYVKRPGSCSDLPR